MDALREQFVLEARELVQQAGDDLIALERDGGSAPRIESVFRAFHTLKGAAGLVDLPAMGLAMHAAEDLLAEVQAGRIGVTPPIIDGALQCLDQVSRWVDYFEADGALPADAGEVARQLAEALRLLLAPGGGGSAAAAAASAVPDWVAELLEEARANLPDAPVAALSAVDYQPHPGCYFNGDDPLGLMRKIPQLLALRIAPREPFADLAEIDPYACNLRLRAIAAVDRAALAAVFRLQPDQVRIVELSPELLAPPPSAAAAASAAPAGVSDLVRGLIEEQARVLAAPGEAADLVGRIGAAARVAINGLRHDGLAEAAAQVEAAAAQASAQSDPAGLQRCLARILAGEAVAAAEPEAAVESAAGGRGSRTLRIEEARIDALVNLAGELTLVKNSLAHLAKRAANGGGDIARLLRHEVDAFERLDAEMRAAILQLRMVPVAQLFRSFPRLVRDLAQRLGKSVALVTEGETTESDKTVVDLLFEPMLHLVRNALDHGIETPEQRVAAGKPEAAMLTLRAQRCSDRFIVEVIDDGRGIDPAMVRRRAADKALLGAAELAALSDAQVIDLVFAPGFSTTAKISDISGRGVGMDIVRATIAPIGGRVTLQSRVGGGTTVRLDLPSSIAMLRIMVVEAGSQLFGIPMDAVSRTVQLAPERISRFKANDGFVLDDRVVPICELAELMQLPAKPAAAAADRLVVVAEVGGKLAGLAVDAIRDRLEVVLKPMQGVLSTARGFAGTTLLGDGRVLLVLDLQEIVP
ncbi:two-component system chemotaxis sensor kinase CheA [Rhodopseudomonas rhenobacensis]|uniref:Chemotaxis protein CheA n=1 Tax=Rhodopseudomonas rhenobacensis TaxID=87461 RepID=A0A7W7Z1B0_9BRAD|nr:chemotaxis protein CheA [Rhodopseudomonas rhenobacensis]MBB5046193.1 two-component system chemotaxis sensor kinase CheA [Rhodopseudomonas rhenobacensis]